MLREIVLDVETTGLRALGGDRIIELACLELINHVPTGEVYHVYINPERSVPVEATRVHGIKTEFLLDKPLFKDVAKGFIDFIADDTFVIHNAPFDIGFLNAELGRLDIEAFPLNRAKDTLKMARSKFPGAQASLDALCKRFSIDLSKRTMHGALLDCELLASVYLELIGGRQKTLSFEEKETVVSFEAFAVERSRREPRPHAPTTEEIALHEDFVKSLKKSTWS